MFQFQKIRNNIERVIQRIIKCNFESACDVKRAQNLNSSNIFNFTNNFLDCTRILNIIDVLESNKSIL